MALLGGALGIAFAPILAKLAMNYDAAADGASIFSPIGVAFWRLALATPVFILIAVVKNRRRPSKSLWPKQARPALKLLVLPGLFFALDMGTWHWALEFTSAANATLEANLAVIFVAFASWLWLGERFNWLFPAGAALAVVGMVRLVGMGLGEGGQVWMGDALGLGAAFAYAGYQLSTKIVVERCPVEILMAITSGVCAVLLLAAALLLPGHVLPETGKAWAAVITLAFVAQVFGQGLIALGLREVPAGLASVVLVAQPVMVAFLGWGILDQPLTLTQAAAGLVVVVGIYLARRGSLKSKPDASDLPKAVLAE